MPNISGAAQSLGVTQQFQPGSFQAMLDQQNNDMLVKQRRLKQKNQGLGLLVVDYLQLMHQKGKVESRQLEVSEIRSRPTMASSLTVIAAVKKHTIGTTQTSGNYVR